jgi:carboxylesterase
MNAFGGARRNPLERSGALRAPAPPPVSFAGSSPGVVAFHGFGGTTREVELCTDVARDLGLSARARCLPGHGSHARDLSRTRFADWVRGAEDSYAELSEAGPVIAVGMSMGSLLAMHLAIEHPERVRGLVLLANAAWLRPSLAYALRVAGLLRIPDFLMRKGDSDLADPEARASQISYTADPVHAAIDLERATRRMRTCFGRIRCKTLILHGALDRVCPVSNAWRVATQLGTTDVRVVIFARSHHILTRDLERAEVARELADFYRKIAAQSPVEP